MATNSFTLGRNCQVVVMGPQGRVDLTHVTSFESRQLTNPVRIARMDGTQLGVDVPKGWEGSFEVERGSSSVDDMIATFEANYFSKGAMPTGTLYQYVTEVDGSTSTYQFDGAVFKLANAGTWKGDQSVKQKLEFFATTRRRV